MIIFIPREDTHLNIEVAERYNAEYADKFCHDHPGEPSLIEVWNAENGVGFKVHGACCTAFYLKLKKFELNDRPFDE